MLRKPEPRYGRGDDPEYKIGSRIRSFVLGMPIEGKIKDGPDKVLYRTYWLIEYVDQDKKTQRIWCAEKDLEIR